MRHRILKNRLTLLFAGIIHSCNNSQQKDFDNSDLMGNWYSAEKDYYQEFYFDGNDKLHEYNPYAGNRTSYSYKIKNDSIFYSPIYNDSIMGFEFFGKITALNDGKLVLEKKTLKKLDDSLLLEELILGEIEENIYDQAISRRSIQSDL